MEKFWRALRKTIVETSYLDLMILIVVIYIIIASVFPIKWLWEILRGATLIMSLTVLFYLGWSTIKTFFKLFKKNYYDVDSDVNSNVDTNVDSETKHEE